MVRAHTVGAEISASHNFFPFSFPTKTSNPVAGQEPAAQGIKPAVALLPQFSSTRSILAREAPQLGLSATQQRVDFLSTQISEAFSNPENLALALGGGVLLRSLRPSLIAGETLFASSVSTLPARARLFGMSAAALGLVACDGVDYHYAQPPTDEGEVVIPDSDGDGWKDDKDCAPNDAHKFPLHDDPYYRTYNNIKNGEYTICPGIYRGVNLIGNNAIIHGENVTLEANNVSERAITQADNAGASTYTGFTIQNYAGYDGAIFILNNNGNTFKNIKMINVTKGVGLYNSDNNLIQGLKMFDMINGISLERVYGDAFKYGSSNDNIIENCEIHSQALVQNELKYGIGIFEGFSNTIRSNVVSKFGHNIGIWHGNNNTLEKNTVVGATDAGILLYETKGNVLTNNNAKNSQTGIIIRNFCDGDPGNVFTWNNFMGNGQSYFDQGQSPSCAGGYDVARITNPANHNLY